MGRLLSLVIIVGLALSSPAASQEPVGDWFFQEDADPFDDTRLTFIVLIVEDSSLRGIRAVGIRCGSEGLHLAVTHSYMAGRDNRIRVQYRLGDAEPQTANAFLSGSNDASFTPVDPEEIQALRASPRIAVRITDPLDNETHVESWADLDGTEEALDRLHCLEEGNGNPTTEIEDLEGYSDEGLEEILEGP